MSDVALAEQLARRLQSLVPALDARLRLDALARVASRVVVLTDGQIEPDAALASGLVQAAIEACNTIEELDQAVQSTSSAYQHARNEAERREVVRSRLVALEPDPRRVARDLAATRRWLDLDALIERFEDRISEQVDQAVFAYRSAAALVRGLPPRTSSDAELDQELLLKTAFTHAEQTHQEAIVIEALRLARAVVERAHDTERGLLLGAHRWALVLGWSRTESRGCWAQIAALELCIAAQPGAALELVSERLRARDGENGMLVRHAALGCLARLELPAKDRLHVARIASDDPSEHVRQGLAQCAARLGSEAAFAFLCETLCTRECSATVRGVALRELGRHSGSNADAAEYAHQALLSALEAAVSPPADTRAGTDLVAAVALEQLERSACGPLAPLRAPLFVPALEQLTRSKASNWGLAARAARLLAAFEVSENGKLGELRERFERQLAPLCEGQQAEVELFPETPREDLEKALITSAVADLPLELAPGRPGIYRVTRGERRSSSSWRWLFELFTPLPDKRQGYAHTSARSPRAETVIAPMRLGEVTPTRVPGERRLHEGIGGWGEFVPRVDDLLAATRLGRPARRLVTSYGTVVVVGPSGLWRRLLARLRLTLRYTEYAEQRERCLDARHAHEQAAYARMAEKLGFRFSVEATTGKIASQSYDRRPDRMLPYLSLTAVVIPPWADDFVNGMLSPSGNTAWHLAIVAWLVFSYMVLRGARIRSLIRRSLASIPLHLGGWGSRGKSGTERLKAALFHALRFDVVVKTTGCEAMMIHARRDRSAREIFLYRPYDKATIWEQKMVLGFAERLKARVFLWECMALQPRFVGILIDEWMQDRLTTLTNAYPDHEDVMGPSGEDVARVISTFMPHHGVAFTAEDQMLPLLRSEARRRATELVEVSPLDAALLPKDLLDRFPYREHPANIALVLAVAEHLGIDRTWALARMADHVVPDLGVLKTYPTVRHRGRRLTFSNGMSANERAGFLSNWTRLGFDRIAPDDQPGVCLVAVVNNRADRVPRSRVFAELLTRDAPCDVIVLIGTNLGGLSAFLGQEIERWIAGMKLGSGDALEVWLERVDNALAHLRLPPNRKTLETRLGRILEGCGLSESVSSEVVASNEVQAAIDSGAAVSGPLGECLVPEPSQSPRDELAWAGRDEALAHADRLAAHYSRAIAFRKDVERAVRDGRHADALRLFRESVRSLWLARIRVVWDSHCTGDQVIDRIAREVPPGHDARLLGCQNIKGTGLDFAYRWTSLDEVCRTLSRLRNDPQTRSESLRWLIAHGDYGVVDVRLALEELRAIVASGAPEWAAQLGELGATIGTLERLEADKRAKLAGSRPAGPFVRLMTHLEPFVDHLDSTRRSRWAKRVMEDLLEQRISQAKAAVLLRDIVARGKGGWLAKDLQAFLKRLRRRQRTGEQARSEGSDDH
ncbi:MAG: capsule biosynthesis protein CapB [Polyangiaceae bacterium]|nr:capsule biosynthesis protein CapB [Polyangiaceae bacterium]